MEVNNVSQGDSPCQKQICNNSTRLRSIVSIGHVPMSPHISACFHKLLANMLNRPSLSKKIAINGKLLLVEWTPHAQRELDRRINPLYVEMELYFSCMVKKYIHFREQPRKIPPVYVNDKFAVYFRPVTSTDCSLELAADLGRQPEMELHNEATSRLLPKRIFIDFKNAQWIGEYWL